jgi:hypothetical protein
MARRSSMAAYPLGCLVKREGEVEDDTGVDLPGQDEVNELGQEPPYGRGPPRTLTWE